MHSKEDFAVIQALSERGVYQKDIAKQLGLHPRTVRRALARGSAPSGERKTRGSGLDPYRETVDRLLREGVWNAVVIWRAIQDEGYAGCLTVVRDYIRPKRALRSGRATVRYETAPGEQVQSDWGQERTLIGGVETEVHFQVNTLGYSRRFHFWCTTSEDAEHTLEGMRQSFEYFGGVPQDVLTDNQKVVVAQHTHEGAKFQERFLDFALYYGFRPKACRPYRARTKGKDERMVSYIKHHFFVRYRQFDSFAHLNQLAEQWLRLEADRRVHGTVGEVVLARFEREAPSLKALPALPYDTAYLETRRVAADGYVDVRANRYSVPSTLIGATVRVRIGLDDQLRIYHDEQLVVTHRLQQAAAGWVTVPEHHAALWSATRVQTRPLVVYEEVGAWS